MFHENQYNQDKSSKVDALKEYDQVVSDYYSKRTDGKRTETWSQQVANFLEMKQRTDMLDELHDSGFVQK